MGMISVSCRRTRALESVPLPLEFILFRILQGIVGFFGNTAKEERDKSTHVAQWTKTSASWNRMVVWIFSRHARRNQLWIYLLFICREKVICRWPGTSRSGRLVEQKGVCHKRTLMNQAYLHKTTFFFCQGIRSKLRACAVMEITLSQQARMKCSFGKRIQLRL